MAQIPIFFPFITRVYPSAIPTTARSVQGMIGRMSNSAAASIRGFTGKQKRKSDPSCLRMLATTEAPFNVHPPFGALAFPSRMTLNIHLNLVQAGAGLFFLLGRNLHPRIPKGYGPVKYQGSGGRIH